MNNLKAIFVCRLGLAIQTIGLILDIAHHLNIGIETPEGLFTFNHFVIFAGFVVIGYGVLRLTKTQ